MIWVHLLMAAALLGFYGAYEKSRHSAPVSGGRIVLAFAIGLFLRILLAFYYGQENHAFVFVDMAVAGGIFYWAKRKYSGEKGFWLSCIYLFNPAVLGYTSVWGVKEGFWMYPILFLLLFCYIYSGNPRFFDCYVIMTAGIFYENIYAFRLREILTEGERKLWMVMIGALFAAAAVIFSRIILRTCESEKRKGIPAVSVRILPFGRKDGLIIAGLCVIYGCAAFWNLGSMKAPETQYTLKEGESLVFDFEKDTAFRNISWYLMDEDPITMTVEYKSEGTGSWSCAGELTMDAVFTWGSFPVDFSADSIRLTNLSGEASVAELVFQDEGGELQIPEYGSEREALFDEADTFPEELDYRSSVYFDEKIYSRTAYEFLNGLTAREVTHPPLGKILISIGTLLFGTTPFGFRFMGALVGILMLPFVYLLGRDIGKSRFLGGFAAFLFAFDFMHFTQTRLATIDVYITFFTILMFFFMYRYSRLSFYDTPLKKTFIPLGACGISFGMGIACKWTGFYAGLGLAVLFFRVLYLRYREYVYACEKPGKSSNGIQHEFIQKNFKKYALWTIAFCIVFFVLLPFGIYTASYLPFLDGTDSGLLERMWNNQKLMLEFHGGLDVGHPYSSYWYQWPVMIRPVFYYSRVISDTVSQGISAFGNPMVWWAGIPAAFYMIYRWIKYDDGNARFLCIAYGACYLPWSLVTRCTFAYHYFPCVPLVCCMLMYSFGLWRTCLGRKKWTAAVMGYAMAALVLFAMFYPVISGTPVSKEYVADVLRWMKTWVLVL